MKREFWGIVFAVAVAAAGCSGGGGSSVPNVPNAPASSPTPSGQKIQHIVIMIQENRSFDNLFATYPGADGATYGILHDGKKFKLVKAPLPGEELNHVHRGFLIEYDGGKMDGFNKIHFGSGGAGLPAGTYPLRYVDPSQIAPYWTMAKNYSLADHMFQTQGSGSFTAHQELIAAGTAIGPSKSVIDFPSQGPWGCDAPPQTVTSYITPTGYFRGQGPFPCLTYKTLADLLDPRHISWKYYTPAMVSGSSGFLWNAPDAIHDIRYGPDWAVDDVSPETTVFKDISANKLPAVCWVIPSATNSDHAENIDNGPSWVASVVNAIGRSSAWQSTVIIVVWDDWGGYYDNAVPPQLDYQGLGFRVPMLVISPYAKSVGYVSHTQYEFGSIVKFVEQNWSLGNLGATDVRATSIADMFDFSKPPRAFAPIPAALRQSFFEHEAPSSEPVDDK
ncbi:MAG: alkaline phosphatase family protein [Candidatus Tumulicola sp.]